ncbi:uncharacterized protein Z520_06323 [Fonsecaea multimorphosa CBS 102226]|uniref:Arrestin-like N-terminal domain-containing protein n=1 Tax=Fonsecaea multimorphosa CBS 102226 TaxID=1442371 RepID=A0A0D2KNE5_9EURO|nr:uncharacterized protein Z520_06323 [Fonsecaea multimorphosa CBS 102226]KIX98243.1 hypothetical protein Z520_06323 [Fonsecaea multimorphosa CBS 102226]
MAENLSIAFDISEQQYWLPGEHIRGSVIIKVPFSTAISSARIDFEGLSLIHTTNNDRSTTFSTHKFLYQNHDVRSVTKVSDVTQKTCLSTYRIPFDFLISSTISSGAGKLPDGGLELPPTMLIGRLVWSRKHGRVFAQPNISYHLVAKVALVDQSSSNTRVLREEKPIKIWKSSSSLPPISLGDFAAEYRTVAETQCALRRLLVSPKLRLTISTTEPAAVAFSCRNSDQVAHVDLSVRLSRPASSHADEGRLRSLLDQKVKIQVQACLRAKTFYSPVAFEKFPGQTMLTPTSSCRMNDKVFQLGAVMGLPVDPAVAAWRRPSIHFEGSTHDGSFAVGEEKDEEKRELRTRGLSDDDAHASKVDGAIWHSHFYCPLTIPHGLVPTFWSPTASQQYSLLLGVKVLGIKSQTKLRLEVPLQIYYDLGPVAAPCGPRCRRLLLGNGETGRPQRDQQEGGNVSTTIVMHDVGEGSPPMYV